MSIVKELLIFQCFREDRWFSAGESPQEGGPAGAGGRRGVGGQRRVLPGSGGHRARGRGGGAARGRQWETAGGADSTAAKSYLHRYVHTDFERPAESLTQSYFNGTLELSRVLLCLSKEIMIELIMIIIIIIMIIITFIHPITIIIVIILPLPLPLLFLLHLIVIIIIIIIIIIIVIIKCFTIPLL